MPLNKETKPQIILVLSGTMTQVFSPGVRESREYKNGLQDKLSKSCPIYRRCEFRKKFHVTIPFLIRHLHLKWQIEKLP